MSTFLGIGLGPIQTGIFLSGASRGGVKRLVVAEVDQRICKYVRDAHGSISINIASKDMVLTEEIAGIEIYNPLDKEDLKILMSAASEAGEISTALPSVKFFQNIAPWLKEAFMMNPGGTRIVYTSENDNYAAEALKRAIGGNFQDTHYLNTVIGKMSGIVAAEECRNRRLALLTPDADRGHLVEEFNRILISECPGIENRKVAGLHPKKDLIPFEEAKLYGHNAIHLLLGLHASQKGLRFMHELSAFGDIIETGRRAFIDESGKALCKKWSGADELFREDGFKGYAEDLLQRMMNPFLQDQVDRVCRDMERKLGWNDRIIGTIRLILRQGFTPSIMAESAAIAATRLFGKDPGEIRKGLGKLWNDAPINEQNELQNLICKKLQP